MHGITLLELPLDILAKIFSILDGSDLSNLIRTCKTLKNFILHDNTIWRNIAKKRLIIRDHLASVPDSRSWYSRCRISHNWCKGIFKKQRALHYDTLYIPWLELHKSQMLLLALGSEMFCFSTDRKGSPNCRTSLWSLHVPIIRRYDIRTNDISRFVIKDNILLCGNRDGSAAVFHSNNPRKKPSLLCHIDDCHQNGEVEVTAIEGIKTEDKLCLLTGSCKSSELCLWSWNCSEDNYDHLYDRMQNSECKQTIQISCEEVGIRCLSMNKTNNKLAIGLAGNTRPLLLDCQMCAFQLPIDQSLNMKRDAVKDITWHNENTIAYVSHAGRMQLLDIRTNHVIYRNMDPFHSSLYCLKTDGNNALIAGASEFSRCVLFDDRQPGRHVQMYFTQKNASPVYSLVFNSTKLIAAADRSIGLVDFDVNSSVTRRYDYSDVFEFVKR
ncbi:PREDICTED: F-box/WD repeat-containing protein 4-like [Papilio xuthus]|uniref:F-box/WD repeat-containing protein 4-like n=1 Tax=Papilio xuthus TaxID=66420 RepID=A0AAJ7E7D4_PAPXU|nr:PREDICTED: F-box/WD repeat-containing protein 4-like [Papilio xuthus]